jgi:hypothetical protein
MQNSFIEAEEVELDDDGKRLNMIRIFLVDVP